MMDWWAAQHLIDTLEAAPVRLDPYPHLYIDHIVPALWYDRLLQTRPSCDTYELKSSYPGRRTEVCRALPPAWQAVQTFLHGEAFRNALLTKFGMPPQGRSLSYLHRDLDGFHITPHTDVPAKLVSYILYLPDTPRYAHLGTWMLRPLTPGYPWSETHKPWEDFERVTMAPYLPNSLFVWQVTQQSYHAVDVRFTADDTVQARHTWRGFVFRDDVPLPYTFAEDYGA